MKLATSLLVGVAVLGGALASTLIAQDKKAAPADHQAPPMEKPAPEHALLAKWVGNWDAKVTNSFGPAPENSVGSMTCHMVGGYWLVCDFKGTMMGAPFEGHELDGWDATKKKYTSVWVDSMSSGATTGEGTFDSATKRMTTKMAMAMGATTMPVTSVCEWKSDDLVDMTMTGKGPDGKDATLLHIEYKRRK